MGTVSRFNISNLMARYNLKHFVETGTGHGDSLAYAASVRPHFLTLWSCEIHDALASDAGRRFRDDTRVCVRPDRSLPFLDSMCREIPQSEPIMFWLDAHFPGADYGLLPYGAEPDESVRLPLADELRAIHALRRGKDVIAVDDMRIYADGAFQHGNLPDSLRAMCPKRRSTKFVSDIMADTHDVHMFFEHEGYILLTPRGELPDGA